MRVPLSWLQEFVAFDVSPAEVAELLTIAGVEVSKVEDLDSPPYDTVLHLEILANIARCQSVRGVAREVAAVVPGSLLLDVPVPELTEPAGALTGESFAPELCRRFVVGTVTDVEVGSSPDWLRTRLLAAGVPAVSNVVDAANYVMLEFGQPLHTYDAAALPGNHFTVRQARSGESLRLLSQPEAEAGKVLVPGTPVVACEDHAVALAGVVGGWDSAITAGTTSLLVESANFPYPVIRRSQDAHRIKTEASGRFSRGVDPAMATIGLARFVEVLRLSSPGATLVDWREWTAGDERRSDRIRLDLREAERILGATFVPDEVGLALERVGLPTAVSPDRHSIVSVATSMRSDVTISADLLEEVARLYGFERLALTMPTEPIPDQPRHLGRVFREQARDAAVVAGLQEVITYSMTSPELEQRLEPDNRGPYVEILNPISPERRVMRRSLLPELLATAARYHRSGVAARIFELGQVFRPELPGDLPDLPAEPYSLCFVLHGGVSAPGAAEATPRVADAHDGVAVAMSILDHLHLDGVRLVANQVVPFHPGVCATVRAGGDDLGHVGELHPVVARRFGFEWPVVIGEFHLDEVVSLAQVYFKVRPVSRYPSVDIDVSVSVPTTVSAGDLLDTAVRAAGDILEDVRVFDVFTGGNMAADRKAVGLRFTFNTHTQTMTTGAAQGALGKVLAAVEASYGAVQR